MVDNNRLAEIFNALWQDAERIVAMPPNPHEPIAPQNFGQWQEGDEILEGIFATASQAKALNMLWQWYTDSDEPEFALLGYAGTGKTVLVQAFIKALRSANVPCDTMLATLEEAFDKAVRSSKIPCETVFTAPTNKATAVLDAMVGRWKLGIGCRTAASLLGLKPKRDHKTGIEIFTQERKRSSDFYDLLVVDESSMVSDDQDLGDIVAPGLFRLIRNGLSPSSIPGQTAFRKVLYIGDPAQIPPVGQKCSPVFMSVKNKAVLTDVKRYGGAILELATYVRDNLNSRDMPEMKSNPEEGLWVIPATMLPDQLRKAAQKGAFTKDSRAIAWTNPKVNSMASLLRTQLYGDNPPQLVEGELIVVGSPYAHKWMEEGKEKSEVLLRTSEEYTIASVRSSQRIIRGIESPALGIGPDNATWDVLEVSFTTGIFSIPMKDPWGDMYEIKVPTVPVLAKHEEKRYKATLKALADTAKKQRQWKPYWALKDAFADLRSALSLTVHKAQGSTFTGFTFVDAANIYRCPDDAEYYDAATDTMQPSKLAQQLFYTAITRAGGKLIIGV